MGSNTAPKYHAIDRTTSVRIRAPTPLTASSARSVQNGLVILRPVIIVASDAAMRSWDCIVPTGVDTLLSSPDAVILNITILPLRSGNSSCNAYTGVFHLKSNQILPLASVSIILYFGMRSFSTPAIPVFIWKDTSPAAMRKISILIDGNNLPSDAMTRGIRRVTPSFSGAITIIPTALALSAIFGIGPTTPGYLYTHGCQSSPTVATPRTTPVLLLSLLGICPITVGVFLSILASASSLPNLSGSANRIGTTTIEAPA